MGIAKITRNNQITLTSDVIKLTDFKEGDSIIEEVTEDGRVILRKRESKSISSLFGSLKGQLEEVRKDIEATRNAW